jgi:dolichol-phosphate mannosyltransferase
LNLAVVIAAMDERDNVGPLCRRLLASLRAAPELRRFEVIFVVEGSDGTEAALAAIAAGGAPEIRVIRPPRSGGLGAAFRFGFAAVAPDVDLVATLDADLNHAPEDIPRLVRAIERHRADIVIGSRRVPGARSFGQPRWKRLLSLAGNAAIRRQLRTGIRDQTSGFRVYRAAALARLTFRSDGFAFVPEILSSAAAIGLRIHEEPIDFRHRIEGRSKLRLAPTARDYLRLMARGRPR